MIFSTVRSHHGCLPVLLLLCVFFCTGTALATEQPLVVRVGLYENPPKIFTQDGQPAGIFVDIIEEIARKEGWQLRYLSGTWAKNLDRLEHAEIDLMPDMAYSAERDRLYAFPQVPALSSWFQVYAPHGHKIHSILDLNHKRIMVLERSIQETAFERLRKGFALECELIQVGDYKSMFERVQKGEADVAVTNRFYGMMNGRAYGLEDTSVVFEPSDLYYAAAEGDPKHLLPILDRYLSQLKSNPNSLYYQSVLRWTSQKVNFHWPLWLKIGGGVGIGVLLFSLLGGVLLKYQVNVRTRELRKVNQDMEARIRERTAELATITREQISIFESAGVGIIMLRDRVIVRCNPKMTEMTGYGYDELIGMSTRMWYGSQQAFEQASYQVYAQLARGETHRRSQQVTRKDGTVFWARLSLRAFDESNPKDGAVAILEDISEERRAAETLRRAMEKAQEADRTKSAFLATMSHELRTPLNSIIGFTGILVQGLAGPLNEEQNKQLRMVQKSSRHLLSLINDVLDISKIEAGELELSLDCFELHSVLLHVLSLVRPLAEEKGLMLEFPGEQCLGSINTDKRRFEQILINLLNNAIKFTEQGSVLLTCQDQGDTVILNIKDTGIGMEKRELKRIFHPFHQVESGLARKHEGTGLGLAICQRLARQMGGAITVTSTQGQGSTFTLVLPQKGTRDPHQEEHA
nr:ATP-binding protein [uncultured Desulfobulbus sp.]